MEDGWCGRCKKTHWHSICEAEERLRACADMIEELLSDDPGMPTRADTIRRAEALLAELRSP